MNIEMNAIVGIVPFCDAVYRVFVQGTSNFLIWANMWIKRCSVTIQTNATEYHLHVMLFTFQCFST